MHRSIFMLTRTFSRSLPLASASRVGSSSTGFNVVGLHQLSAKRTFFTTQQRFGVANELRSALEEEIKAEKELVQDKLGGSAAPSVPGFKITTNGAEVKLTKTYGNEKIVVNLNVNHSVGIEEEDDVEEMEQSEEGFQPVPVALPHFTICVTKDNQTLYFALEMVRTEEGGYDFTVEEFFIAPTESGEAKLEIDDAVYSSSGKYIDPKLHDLLFVNYLEERGFTADFCQQLVSFVTHYEHELYVNFLDKIKKFVAE